MALPPPQEGSQSLSRSDDIARVIRAHEKVCAAQAELLLELARLAAYEDWELEGAHDAAHFISQVLQVSYWRAERWIGAGVALSSRPSILEALRAGELSIYAVIELCRMGGPEEEDALRAWAKGASFAKIKRAAEAACVKVEDARAALDDRYLEYRYTDEGTRFELRAELPGKEGAIVAARLDALAKEIPVLPGEEPHPGLGDASLGTRRADALVSLCSFGQGEGSVEGSVEGSEPSQIVPTIFIHASIESLLGLEGSEVEAGPAICRETLERLFCSSKVRGILQDGEGKVLDLGRSTRRPSVAQVRQLRYRDKTCTFPGCSHRRFTQAHHIRWWSKGGRTDLENLALVCTFHHILVHEHGWKIRPDREGGFDWFRPDGVRYRAGPSAA